MPRATFKQVSLKPGRYHLGGGIFRDLTTADLAEYVKGTRALLQAGHHIPMLFEHAAPGSVEGAPIQLSITDPKASRELRRKKLAEQVKHGAGWLRDVEQTKEGDLSFTVEANDPEAIKGLRNQTIKFTSPELREQWTDGKGKAFPKIVSHVALTHKPRNTDQSKIEEVVSGTPAEAVQFSLADWQQFSEEEDNDGGPNGRTPAPDEAENDYSGQEGDEPKHPDAPKDDDGSSKAQFAALIEHLAKMGLDLTSDTTEETLIRDLLTACKVKCALEALDDEEEDEDDDEDEEDHPDDQPEPHEEKPPVQFSLADVTDPAANVPKLLGLVMQGHHDKVVSACETAQREGQFPPSLTSRLKEFGGTMQFSADADEAPVFTLTEVVRMLREALPSGAYTNWTVDQFSAATVDLPPNELTTPNEGIQELTPEQAKAYVDAQKKAGVII